MVFGNGIHYLKGNIVARISPDFSRSHAREPHRGRANTLLRAHPEMRRFIGKNPYSFLVILALVGFQIGTSVVMRRQPWWVLAITAFLVGAFVSHALWVMIHECAHRLIFGTRRLDTLAGIFANLPHLLPSSVAFQHYHLNHHAFQGVYSLDADLPSYWEARLIGNDPLRKAIWLLLFPVFQITRPLRLKQLRLVNRWVLLNVGVQVAFDFFLYVSIGPRAFLYLFLSFIFSVGLHPLGARWIQEHYVLHSPQETYSYYGPVNRIAFNVGYHNEHHDLPSVPWNHLPDIRKAAPEMYDTLVFHTSWMKLLLRFIFDRNVSLFLRFTREKSRFLRNPESVFTPRKT